MPNITFLDRVRSAADRFGDRPALSMAGHRTSYAELFAASHGIRNLIVDGTSSPIRRIGIVTGDDLSTYASLLSAWSLGAAYVPLNVNSPADRNARIIEQADLDVILTSRPRDEWHSHMPHNPGSVRVVATAEYDPDPAPMPFADSSLDDIAYIFFTSGSTGMPKGVPISHRNVTAFMNSTLDECGYEFSEHDRFLQMFELTFDLSVVSILTPMSVGGCCCVVPEKGIAYLNVINTLSTENVTVALMVPSILPYLERFFDEIRLPEMRLSQFCGEALMQDMAAGWAKCVPGATIENVYGPTEATIYCTRYEWHQDRAARESHKGIVPIGRSIPGMAAFVVDDKGSVVGPGAEGELCLAGNQLMSGYWNDPAKTNESFVSLAVGDTDVSAYRTGDIAYENQNGDLVFCGRKDSQVKIDGHRIELGEIEFFARQFIKHSAAAVIVSEQTAGHPRLKLFVGGNDIDRSGLEQYFKDNLPAYMWPSEIVVLDELPLNLNGKIDRPALKRL